MNSKEPPTTSKILATPIENVEASRAQRLQRQQSRIRDRGGIFVPTSRNTLADILLGKASPLKKPRRSVSASPSKGRGKSANKPPHELISAASATVRRSPRKKARKSTKANGDGGPTSGPSTPIISKLVKKALLAETPKKTPKDLLRLSKPMKVKNLAPTSDAGTEIATTTSHAVAPAKKAAGNKKPTPKTGKARKATAAKKSSKAKAKDADQAANPEVISLAKDNKSTAKSKSKPKVTSSGSINEETRESASNRSKTITTAIPEPLPAISTSTASRAGRQRRKSDLYSCGESEDEYVPKVPKKKASTHRGGAKATSASSSSKASSSKKATAPPKRRPGASQLPDIVEEDEENLSEEEIPSPKISSVKPATTEVPKSVISNKGKKRLAQDEDSNVELLQPPSKRPKPTAKGKISGASEKEDDPPAKVSKKRARDTGKDADDESHRKSDKPPKGTKRKKGQEVEDAEEEGQPLKKTASSKAKSKPKPSPKKAPVRTSRKAPTKTAKFKENSAVAQEQPESKDKVPSSKRGPPKSVLMRIKNSAQSDVVDNEPDPIDFLS